MRLVIFLSVIFSISLNAQQLTDSVNRENSLDVIAPVSQIIEKDNCTKGSDLAKFEASFDGYTLMNSPDLLISSEMQNVLYESYHILYVPVCTEGFEFCNCYNNTMMEKIAKKFGPDFWNVLVEKASNYNRPMVSDTTSQ